MATLLSQKYSIICYSYSGGSLVFNTPFALGVMTPNHVQAYIEGDLDGLGEQNYLNISYDTITGDTTVTDPIDIPVDAVDGAVTVVFTRTVPKDVLYISFAAGTDVTKTNIDGMVRYTLMALHEVLDGRWDLSFDWELLNEAYRSLYVLLGGGSEGEVLKKTSDTSYDFGWAAPLVTLEIEDNHNDEDTEITLSPLQAGKIICIPEVCTVVHLEADDWAVDAEMILQGTEIFNINLGDGVSIGGIDSDATTLAVAKYPSGVAMRHRGANVWQFMGDAQLL